MLEKLKKLNPDLTILSIYDPAFSKFGRIHNINKFKEAINYLENSTEVPKTNNLYVPDDSLFKKALTNTDIYTEIFGGIELQYGYVNGNNSYLNALEYHKTSEINIAVTPMVLMLGHVDDIKTRFFDTIHLSTFYLPKYTAIELYSKTLHFSPCKVQDTGFICGVILPEGTNVEFVKSVNYDQEENYYLLKTNKWLLAHEEFTPMVKAGAHIGLKGKNHKINY
jgi:hypothetical protein